MFNVGGGELLVIMLIALIVLGPQRLPGAVRTAGRVMGELRRVSSGFQQELRQAFDDVDVDVDVDRSPRRRGAVPLASAVAEAEADARSPDASDDPPASGDVDDEGDAPAPVPGGDAITDQATLPPAIADALDEIVTPLDPTPTPASDLPDASGGTTAAAGADDERAAS
jgi:sec-independent protein translocase protein TatB